MSPSNAIEIMVTHKRDRGNGNGNGLSFITSIFLAITRVASRQKVMIQATVKHDTEIKRTNEKAGHGINYETNE